MSESTDQPTRNSYEEALAFWKTVPGAELFVQRQEEYMSFHDTDIHWIRMEPTNGGILLDIRMELCEAGPLDQFTLRWKNPMTVQLASYDHREKQIYIYYLEETSTEENKFEIRMDTNIGDIVILGNHLEMIDYVCADESGDED